MDYQDLIEQNNIAFRNYENENDYRVVISKLDDAKFNREIAIVNEEENLLYIKKKAIKEELKRRLRGNV